MSSHTTQSLPSDAVWFVTGCSSGIGLSLITAVLSHPGHRIVVLSRNPSTITLPFTSTQENTLLQSIDLTSSTSISDAFTAALAKFGRIDVVVNNAGFSLLGEFESITEEASRELFEINYWAPVIITRHALRIMREVNPKSGPIGGVIVQISSIGGYVSTAGIAPYNASKFALEGFTEAVAKEIDPAWNIGFAIIQPGSVKTKWASANMVGGFPENPAYVKRGLATEKMKAMQATIEPLIGAEPDTVAGVIAAVARGEQGDWSGTELLRLPLGADAYALIHEKAVDQVKRIGELRELSESTSTVSVKETLRRFGFLKD